MDSPLVASALIVFGLLALLGAGIWMFAAMLIVSIVGLVVLKDFSFDRIGSLMQAVLWKTTTSYELAALPLFVLMAEILFRTRLSEQLFRGLAPWVNWMPGRLLHVCVWASGVFGAVSGSSAATCATVSKIALPEMKRRGYDHGLAVGALCSGGTLGMLIPPSIVMVIYAVAAEVSLVKLMIAGVLPGILMMVLFSAWIAGWSLAHPHRSPPAAPSGGPQQWLASLRDLGPISLLLLFVFGALFSGWITATECAAWGVLGSLLLAQQSRSLNWEGLAASVRATLRTSCMIIILVAAAGFLSAFMAMAGIPKAMAQAIGELGLSPYALIVALTLVYIVLGIFLDGISMILLTLPVVLPIVTAAGFDPLWFGIFLIICIEMAEISPPVGFNLFVLQKMTGDNVFTIGRMSLPFFALMVVCVAILTAWPGLVMLLPDLVMGR
ncbi:MAG: TRAP transporter large permease subunit [Rubrivivax sp.]